MGADRAAGVISARIDAALHKLTDRTIMIALIVPAVVRAFALVQEWHDMLDPDGPC